MRPRPNSSTPTLLLMVLRFLTPFFTSARMRFSGIPHSPNPPTMMVAPSLISATASSAFANTLFIDMGVSSERAIVLSGGAMWQRGQPDRVSESKKMLGVRTIYRQSLAEFASGDNGDEPRHHSPEPRQRSQNQRKDHS